VPFKVYFIYRSLLLFGSFPNNIKVTGRIKLALPFPWNKDVLDQHV
jgi:hypothetical protein